VTRPRPTAAGFVIINAGFQRAGPLSLFVRRYARTVLHNRYLPGWVHRLANGILAGLLALMASVAVVRVIGTPLGMLWVALPVAVCGMALDPSWFSLVEGCAGDLGYDELLKDAGKPDDVAWGEAFDV
jgi:hypothetical protein